MSKKTTWATPHIPALNDFEASEIAEQWHSVQTWSDPGVAIYSITSTGKIHSEKHRAQVIAYIDGECLDQALECDARGDDPIVCDSNHEDLLALREWARNFKITEVES